MFSIACFFLFRLAETVVVRILEYKIRLAFKKTNKKNLEEKNKCGSVSDHSKSLSICWANMEGPRENHSFGVSVVVVAAVVVIFAVSV